MKNQVRKGMNTPVAMLLKALEPENPFDDFRSNSGDLSGLDSYENWIAKGSPDNALIEVPLGAVVLDAAMQIRKKTDPKVVRKYAEAIESGTPFPPVTLARIEGVLVLIDGWHRLNARKSLGEAKIQAFVSVMRYDDARWASASANLANGVPLRPAEVLEAFHTFMDTYGYRVGYSWLSYREIAKKFGKHHTTIRNWMKKYYPRIFKRYQQDEGSGTYKDWDGAPSAVPGKLPSSSDSLATGVVKQAKEAIANTLNLGDTLDPSIRGEVIEALRQALQKLEGQPYIMPFGSDF